jgi:uncharacterized delta-60 repeat protein
MGYDYSHSIQQTADGGYIVAGCTESFGAGDRDFWVLKLDGNGSVIWQKAYGGPGSDEAWDIRQTADGGYVVAGTTDSYGEGNGDLWVLKLDSEGDVEWEKVYGGTEFDGAAAVRQLEDGGYIIAGGTSSFGAGSGDYWLLKLDGSGNVVWEKTYGGTEYDYVISLDQTSDKGYVVAGYSFSFGTTNSAMWIVKVDENGSVLWQKAYDGAGYDYARSIHQTQDGGYIVAGATTSFGAGNYDFWVMKLDENGVITSQKAYGGSNYDYANSIRQTQDGGYLMAGSTRSFGAGNDDLWLLKLDSSGAITWEKTYGGAGYEGAYFANQLQDGTIIATGGVTSFGAGDRDFWVLKLDSAGSIGYCPFEGISIALVIDTAATVIDTTAVPITSTATATGTTATVSDTTAVPLSVCGVPSGPERLKIGSTRKKKGDGNITSLDGLIDCPDTCQTLYTTGISTILYANPATLSTFIGWKPTPSGCETTNPVCQITMDEKKSIKAIFQGPNKLKVVTTSKNGAFGSVSSGDGFINCPTDCEESYILNAPVTLTATAGTDSRFVKWTGNPCKTELSNVCTFEMNKNTTIKAIFEPDL